MDSTCNFFVITVSLDLQLHCFHWLFVWNLMGDSLKILSNFDWSFSLHRLFPKSSSCFCLILKYKNKNNYIKGICRQSCDGMYFLISKNELIKDNFYVLEQILICKICILLSTAAFVICRPDHVFFQ